VSTKFNLIVTGTSPLFTLVLAGALDVLLRPGIAVSIPDVVYIEATRVHGAPGAEQIVAWINAHLDAVRIIPTDIGIDQQRRLEEGRSIRGLGEQAAIETLERFLRSDPAAEALLLFIDPIHRPHSRPGRGPGPQYRASTRRQRRCHDARTPAWPTGAPPGPPRAKRRHSVELTWRPRGIPRPEPMPHDPCDAWSSAPRQTRRRSVSIITHCNHPH
jgi:hypothetical protein